MRGAIANTAFDLSHAARELAAAALSPLRPAADTVTTELPSLGLPTVLEVLRRRALLHPGAPALRFAGDGAGSTGPLSYADLYGRAARTTAVLREFGITPGDPVAVILPLLPQSYPILLGALGAGIVQPINPELGAAAMEAQLRASGAKAVFALGPTPGRDTWERTAQALRGVRTVDLVLQVNTAAQRPDWLYQNGRVNFDALLCSAPVPPLQVPATISPSRIAVMTARGGARDGVHFTRQSHQGLMRQLRADSLLRGWRDGERIDLGRPLFHVPGAVGWGLLPLAKGMRATVAPALA